MTWDSARPSSVGLAVDSGCYSLWPVALNSLWQLWLQEPPPALPARSHHDHCQRRRFQLARCPLLGEDRVVNSGARFANFPTAAMFPARPVLTDRAASPPGRRRSLRGRLRVRWLGLVSKLEATVLFVLDRQKRKPSLRGLPMNVSFRCESYWSPKSMVIERSQAAASRMLVRTVLELAHQAAQMMDQSTVALRTFARLA